MNILHIGWGIILLCFCFGIIFLPDVFNIGSIIGVAIFILVIGFLENTKGEGK